jgi:GldM N-terminal domain
MLRSIIVVSFAFIFSSCSHKSDSTLAVFKATEEGFIQSNSVVSNSSFVIYKELDSKLTKPESARQASVWQPKAMLIKEKSAGIIRYLDSLIVELKKEAGLKLVNMREVYREDDLDAVSRLFISKNTGEELFEKLQNYKLDVLAVDPELNKQFGSNSIIISRCFELEGEKQKDFTKTFFDRIPVITALAMIRKLENNIRVLENEFITYCNHKVAGYTEAYTFISTLIGQSCKYVKAGDNIEIQAGIGAYSLTSNPKVTIMGEDIDCKENGFASYKFKTPNKAGKYSVPVKIEYTDYDGTKKVILQKVEYTVAE